MSRSPVSLIASRLQAPVSRRGFIKAIVAWLAGNVLLPARGAAQARPAAPPPGRTELSGVTSQTESPPTATVARPGDLARPRTSLDHLTYSLFAQQVGQVFRVHPPAAEWVDLELSEAADLTPRYVQLQIAESLPVAGECFSLLFRGPHDRPLSQDTYRLTHESLGEFVSLIVPLFPGREARYYEAVFNRLAPIMPMPVR